MTFFDYKEPLWLPRGSVRALIAVLVISTFCAACFVESEAAKLLGPFAGVVLTAYFQSRPKLAEGREASD